MAAVKVTSSISWDDGAVARVKTKLRAVGKRVKENRVHVGVTEEEGSKIKLDYEGKARSIKLIDAMIAHEFGNVPGAPERSWFRSWFDTNAERLRREMAAAKRAEYKGDKGAVGRQAVEWAEQLRAWITADQAELAPLADSTVRRREAAGLSAGPPLFATGQFVEAIKAIVDGKVVGP